MRKMPTGDATLSPRNRSRNAESFRPDRNSISRNWLDWKPEAGAQLTANDRVAIVALAFFVIAAVIAQRENWSSLLPLMLLQGDVAAVLLLQLRLAARIPTT